MLIQYPSKVIDILQENHPTELLKNSYQKIIPRQTRIQLKGYIYRINGHPGVKSPAALVEVPTELITHRIANSWLDEPFPKTFTIRGGNWDLKAKPFENSPKYQYISKYHELDDMSDRKGLTSGWDISEQHLIEFERLYESIRQDGFKTQRELPEGGDVGDEINICIGRNGKLIVKHGYHRISIAKVLGLESVPVYIRVRHKEWQDIRDEASKATCVEQLSTKAHQYISHPDIRSVFEN